ncbi:DUF177 domain-containing protein [Flavobacterium sp. CS20]|uniref:YceD family protein n=1 Tax=Flavobacterium sp. CS20 TaxID=2775246 RepID=UPI001B3A4FD1|nr:DUF177 domain-containing protein [Flavobacterium sp. CS20]QTY28008.1 DUF177 domain-containing protein [Flavobacterium sp. CS20]
MLNLEDYAIHFVGLKEGKHQFEYKINNTFFEEFDYQEFSKSDIQVEVTLIKKNTHLEFDFHIKGKVEVECDLTLEHFDLPIENSLYLVVKFGDEYKEVDEELLFIPHGQYDFQIEQFIYECVALSIPQKKIHPGVEDGTLDSEILEKLNHHSIDREKDLKNNETDPRWDKLKKLLKD